MLSKLYQVTDEQLAEMRRLVKNSLDALDPSLRSQEDLYDAVNLFFPVKENQANLELANFMVNLTGHTLDDITSMHYVSYEEGQFLRAHKDQGYFRPGRTISAANIPDSKTWIFLLQAADEGGRLIVDHKDSMLKKPGEYVYFDGYTDEHEVTVVEKGYRETLVMWYKPKISKSLL